MATSKDNMPPTNVQVDKNKNTIVARGDALARVERFHRLCRQSSWRSLEVASRQLHQRSHQRRTPAAMEISASKMVSITRMTSTLEPGRMRPSRPQPLCGKNHLPRWATRTLSRNLLKLTPWTWVPSDICTSLRTHSVNSFKRSPL